MSTFSGIIFIICIIFAVYKAIKYFLRENKKETPTVIIKENTIDERFYSTPSFDFPNVQSELDMKFIDFVSHNLSEIPNELEVRHYCKY